MIENEIIFVTTSLNTKWLQHQQLILRRLFPNSDYLIMDGRGNWPNVWFSWIDEVKKSDKKYYIHIDEDFFITSKEEVLKTIKLLDERGVDMIGVPDGGHEWRHRNPVSINTFFMIGRVSDIKNIDIDMKNVRFSYNGLEWTNELGIKYKPEYANDFTFKFDRTGGVMLEDFEPYYMFHWYMKEKGLKFEYLYPHFGEEYKSTNPRISPDSEDIGIHMWMTRAWNNDVEDIFGTTNYKRYTKLENWLIENM
jgi:hypothetical protein